MTEKTYYTYDQMIDGVNSMCREMAKDDWRPDWVVGVLRGGIIPAVQISHWWDAKLSSLTWTTRDFRTIEENDVSVLSGLLLAGNRVLLVDDICDSGLTLSQIYQSLAEVPRLVEENLRSAVLHHNFDQDVFEPDYYHVELHKSEKADWIVYPWE